MKYDYLIVGAGFAGAVMAERIASQLDKKVLVVEKRNHIAGNAYDEYDENGILIHLYGPHLFHTNSEKVFQYLSQFTEWNFYEHRVLAKIENDYYPIPINRTTINKLYRLDFKTDGEVRKFFETKKENRHPVNNSEDIIVNQVGYELFEKFFRYYTKKQWDLEPKELSSSVCGRIPVRFNNDDRYFTDKYQFMPKHGYTKMFENMLKHRNIEVMLNVNFKELLDPIQFNKIIYTGPIDYFFDYMHGKLPYRSIRFEWLNIKTNYHQEAAVINYVEKEPEFTRVTEYKHFTFQKSDSTTISREYNQINGEPFYPVPSFASSEAYKKYEKEAQKIQSLILCGRLAEYRYYNMDQVCANALNIFNKISSI